MKTAARINSYLRAENHDLPSIFKEFHKAGLSHVDLNYPEHTAGVPAAAMKHMLDDSGLKLNGTALRFRSEFINGELGNADPAVAEKALQLCREACDYCREAGGKVVTIWLGYDGFDYSFQIDYRKVWDRLVNAYRQICDYAPDLDISIEYKPYQPRAYSFIDSMGQTGMMLADVDRDNLGVTLDYCHMLMKHENPAFAADLFGSRGKLFGIHLNDGYGLNDDGLMIGTATPFKTLEFLFYLKKHDYDGVIYFDTFPVIEDAVRETACNVEMLRQFERMIDEAGQDRIQEIIDRNDATQAAALMLSFLKGENQA